MLKRLWSVLDVEPDETGQVSLLLIIGSGIAVVDYEFFDGAFSSYRLGCFANLVSGAL